MDENSFQKGSRRATFMIVVLALASILTMCSGSRSISTTTIEICARIVIKIFRESKKSKKEDAP